MESWNALGGALPLPALGTGSSLTLVVGLLIVGFTLLGVELFVIPGFGITGILGIAGLLAGVTLGWIQYGALWGVALLGASLLVTLVAVAVLLKSRVGKRLVLESSLAGAVAVPSKEAERLLGAEGVAVTMLRPSGSAEFAGERVEVETDGAYIAKGTPVRVVAVKLGRVVVEEATDEAPGGGRLSDPAE